MLKKHTYNPTLPVKPGITIKENLLANKINDLQAIKLLKMTMLDYKMYLNGRIPITEDFATKIHNICPELEVQFILNLESQYRSLLNNNSN